MTTAHLSESPSFPLSTSSPLADIAAMISVPVGFDDRFPTEWSTPEPVSADECFVFSDSAADAPIRPNGPSWRRAQLW
jgi:hypothetical protein